MIISRTNKRKEVRKEEVECLQRAWVEWRRKREGDKGLGNYSYNDAEVQIIDQESYSRKLCPFCVPFSYNPYITLHCIALHYISSWIETHFYCGCLCSAYLLFESISLVDRVGQLRECVGVFSANLKGEGSIYNDGGKINDRREW